MNDDALRNFAGVVRLFPLPNLVMFPHVVQGLHIFESRYRQMTADALTGDHLIAMALLTADEEDEFADPHAIEPVVCLGKIVWHEPLADGKYNLRLRGLSRARIISELTNDRLYRTARVGLIPDVPADLAIQTQLRRDLAAAVLPRFAEHSAAKLQLQALFEGDMPLGEVCDVLSFALPLPIQMKQLLLTEPHVDRRATAIADALVISAARADRPFPPSFSSN